MAEWPEVPKRKPQRAPRPEPKLTSAAEMSKAIGRVMKRQLARANESQYDVLVCIRSVEAARATFEGVAVGGTVLGYGNAVKAALAELEDRYWDSDGEYTSRGRLGDVCTDVNLLVKRQGSLEHPDIDEQEARRVIITEMAELSGALSGPPGNSGETIIRIEAKGANGTPYYLEITFEVTTAEEFAMHGKIFSDEARQILIQEERLDLIADDGN